MLAALLAASIISASGANSSRGYVLAYDALSGKFSYNTDCLTWPTYGKLCAPALGILQWSDLAGISATFRAAELLANGGTLGAGLRLTRSGAFSIIESSTDDILFEGKLSFGNIGTVTADTYILASSVDHSITLGGVGGSFPEDLKILLSSAADVVRFSSTTGVNREIHEASIDSVGQFANNAVTFQAPVGSTATIDWNTGNIQNLSLASTTLNVTLTLTNPRYATYTILITQRSTGSPVNVVWPATVRWANRATPVISTALGAQDVVTCTYVVTNQYFCSIAQDMGT